MPSGADVDLADPDTYTHGMPHEAFRELRANDPVSWRTERDGRGYWAVTRYRDIVAVVRDRSATSSGVALDGAALPKLDRT